MTDLEKAREMLHSGRYGNCVLYSREIIHTSKARGIMPMMEFLSAGLDLKGFSAADTVAGKALALLFAHAGITAVYADIMSTGAVGVFNSHGIRCGYGKLVETIKNRSGDGVCPMEQAVAGIDEPGRAFEVLRGILKM
ncbi:MAG: DUF1893 domain-containing protein [Oscillospiraceae bacterium]|nr:DUF1893 domain-containing protein [Oscillospiraceae bacterium]